MKTIKALRQFSHYHEGNFSQGDVRPVPDSVAEALIGQDLAEAVEPEADPAPAGKEKPLNVKKAG